MSEKNPGLIKRLSNHFKYYAALCLAEDGPQEKVRRELMKQGWSFKPSKTQAEMVEEIKASSMMGPVAAIPSVRTIILSPENEVVFRGKNRNRDLEARYLQAVKQAAARIYDIRPQP
ncbi:MAG: hypothetical protein HYS17_04540 [Micavibrio aeruginosavorus]|uniref:Uncharacterized protein n=1 Tax=Micavibrio aeruginosavorus TaxID=349221 RepID=A0A7T5R3U9_9BACT|nr:MAG: hypothetical protein HYS17_04540 [Micavibrio aeruginosavorus]